jgi:hypothetical protein
MSALICRQCWFVGASKRLFDLVIDPKTREQFSSVVACSWHFNSPIPQCALFWWTLGNRRSLHKALVVFVVKLLTKQGITTKPVVKLVPLPTQ